MITWVTVWVLTVYTDRGNTGGQASYQLKYASQTTCLIQKEKHIDGILRARCDFQQIPVVTK